MKYTQTGSTVSWVAGALGLAAIIIIIAVAAGREPATTNQLAAVGAETLKLDSSDWVKGTTTAPAVLIEYSDFQCPACRSYYPIVDSLVAEYGDNLAFAYRHFPLKSIHINADLAARAAEAAGTSGKFWEMHKLLFDNQTAWAEAGNARDLMVGYAESLGLDRNVFETTLDSPAVADAVNNDFAAATSLGLNATPTFFLNGTQIQPKSADEFRSLIDAAVNTPKSSETTGTSTDTN